MVPEIRDLLEVIRILTVRQGPKGWKVYPGVFTNLSQEEANTLTLTINNLLTLIEEEDLE